MNNFISYINSCTYTLQEQQGGWEVTRKSSLIQENEYTAFRDNDILLVYPGKKTLFLSAAAIRFCFLYVVKIRASNIDNILYIIKFFVCYVTNKARKYASICSKTNFYNFYFLKRTLMAKSCQKITMTCLKSMLNNHKFFVYLFLFISFFVILCIDSVGILNFIINQSNFYVLS